MAFYIGADAELKKLDFDKTNPSLHTTELSLEERGVKNHFSTKNTLYVGSNLGCGCGFKYALYEKQNVWYDVMDEDIDERENTQKNHLKLIEYLKSILELTNRVEIFVC